MIAFLIISAPEQTTQGQDGRVLLPHIIFFYSQSTPQTQEYQRPLAIFFHSL
jgi:hypothetical protein